VTIEIQQSDSSTGMKNTIDGTCDIGMASRALKDSETGAGLTATQIALDGIAVIVNNENPLTGLTKDQVRAIFTGETLNWSEVG
jgi:phosphate transport system substrate-binding protein